jgi:hypothetical protein
MIKKIYFGGNIGVLIAWKCLAFDEKSGIPIISSLDCQLN